MAENPFHNAIHYQKINFVNLLLEYDKTLINVPNGQGDTALHIAAANCSQELIEHLIKCGASKTQKNLKNQTAEAVARYWDRTEHADCIRDCSASSPEAVEQKKE